MADELPSDILSFMALSGPCIRDIAISAPASSPLRIHGSLAMPAAPLVPLRRMIFGIASCCSPCSGLTIRKISTTTIIIVVKKKKEHHPPTSSSLKLVYIYIYIYTCVFIVLGPRNPSLSMYVCM